MKQLYQSHIRTETINVDRSNVNEAGILASCDILQEVARANDITILEAFGLSSLAAIHVEHYSINFAGQATAGDVLKIQSTYTMTGKEQLQVRIQITTVRKRASVAICSGSFTFINTIIKTSETTGNYADTILA